MTGPCAAAAALYSVRRCGRPATHEVTLTPRPGVSLHPDTLQLLGRDRGRCADHAGGPQPVLSVLDATITPIAPAAAVEEAP